MLWVPPHVTTTVSVNSVKCKRVILHSYHKIEPDEDGALKTKYWAPKWHDGQSWHEWESVPTGATGTHEAYREQVLWKRIINAIKVKPWCSNKDIYKMIPDVNPVTIRGRICELRKEGLITTYWGDIVKTDIRPQGGYGWFNIAYHNIV